MIIRKKDGNHRKLLLVAAVVLIFTALLLNPAVYAAESKEGAHEENEVGLFLGGSHHSEDNGFSIGLDYEHRINEAFGVGALVEYTTKDFDSWVVAFPVYVHPYMGLRLLAAPGFENRESENKFLVRAGIAYQIPVAKGVSLTPEYNVDFITNGEKVHVYGVSVGVGF
jgi:hypothetical protein